MSLHGQQPPAPPRPEGDQSAFRFKSGVELINVNATVSDANGRFVPGLRQEDFLVYEDDQPVTVTHFNAERVPVSLGIALDTSGSMAGNKIQEARTALDRLLFDLLDRQDEIFLYRFSSTPVLLQQWTRDRQQLSRALAHVEPNGGTAMYDAVAESIPLTLQGQNRKKALLVISDGNDTSSATSVRELKAQIRETETLVYAIGIDGQSDELCLSTTAGAASRAGAGAAAFPGRPAVPGRSGRHAAHLPASAADRRRRQPCAGGVSTTIASTSSRCAT